MTRSRRTGDTPFQDAALELVRRELELAGFSLPKRPGLAATTIVQEISYALKPRLHERKIPPYGAVLCFADSRITGGRERGAGCGDLTFIRSAADGRRSMIVYPGIPKPELWELDTECNTELDLVRLAEETRGLALKRIESGLVSLVYDRSVFTVRNREWLIRRPIELMTGAVTQVSPGTYLQAQRLLELCCYVLSPKNIGATFVWFLDDPTEDEAAVWSSCPDVRSLELRCDIPNDHSLIAHLARHRDGAFLVDRELLIRSVGGLLSVHPKTVEVISPYRGTRHTSAKRYSYEHERALVFVVSEDGHVSVFSDGAKVADSPLLLSAEAKMLRGLVPEKGKDVIQSILERVCSNCGKRVAIQELTLIGWKEPQTVSCPICGHPDVYSAMCWSLVATPIKLREWLRQRNVPKAADGAESDCG